MPNRRLPQKKQLVAKLITNFVKPGVKKIYLEEGDFYHITVVVDSENNHIIDNLIELEEAVSSHEKVKFFFKEEWDSGELIWVIEK